MRRRLYRALDHPELCDDERFNDITGLLAGDNYVTLGGILVQAFEQLSVDEVVKRFVEAEIPVARILEPDEVFEDEQMVHNGTFVTWEHPQAGTVRQPRNPVRFASAETPVLESVPGLGEHTDEILQELGRSAEQIAALREAGAVA
jgi:crotonobetainyl-CoA:carnitine CoA-transferase CaiB-like acyl-CoA transferase